MITKECFCAILKAIKSLSDREEQLISLNLLPIENGWGDDIGALITALGKETEPNLAEDVRKICGYLVDGFIFDWDWGTKYAEDDYLIKVDDVKYTPKTFEELYDVIMIASNTETTDGRDNNIS